MRKRTSGIVLSVLGIMLAGASGSAWSAAAGEVITVVGRASSATQAGRIRALAVGATVEDGETLVTSANSFLRIKFVDDAYVILRPNTRFHIEGYNVSEQADENESIFRLLKGGFRTVTGLIGQRNRAAYRVRTNVSTIGIRGTEFQFMHCEEDDCGPNMPDGDYLGVDEGEVEMTTGAGVETFTAGKFAYVSGPNVPPAEVPPAQAGLLSSDPCPGADCGQ